MIRHAFHNGFTAIVGLAGFVVMPFVMAFVFWQVASSSPLWNGLAVCSGDAERFVTDFFEPSWGPLASLVIMVPLFFACFALANLVDWLWKKIAFQSEER